MPHYEKRTHTPLLLLLMLLPAGTGMLISCAGTPEETPTVSLEIVSGDDQTGPVGQELPEAVRVVAKTSGETATSGLTVSFRVAAGGGRLSDESVVTDTDGMASVRWTLGAVPVWNRITAEAGESIVTFQAWAEPGPPPELELAFQAAAGFNSEGISLWPGHGLFLGTEGGLLLSPAPGVDPRPLSLTGEELLGPLGMTFGLSGDLYVCDSHPPYGSVKRVTPPGVGKGLRLRKCLTQCHRFTPTGVGNC